MRLKLKVAAVVAAAALLIAAFVAVAHAAVVAPYGPAAVALQVGDEQGTGYSGSYGEGIVLQPAGLTTVEKPGDKFHFQVLGSDENTAGVVTPNTWMDFRDFEDIQLEDTNTVLPFTYLLGIDDAYVRSNGDVVFPKPPYQIRCTYSTSVTQDNTSTLVAQTAISETETVSLEKNTSTKVVISKSGTVKYKGTTFHFQVSPNSGPGTIRVTISRSGAKSRKYAVLTDEDGFASAKLKLGTKKATYKVSAKFLGNMYGSASKTATKKFKAAH